MTLGALPFSNQPTAAPDVNSQIAALTAGMSQMQAALTQLANSNGQPAGGVPSYGGISPDAMSELDPATQVRFILQQERQAMKAEVLKEVESQYVPMLQTLYSQNANLSRQVGYVSLESEVGREAASGKAQAIYDKLQQNPELNVRDAYALAGGVFEAPAPC